MSKRTIILLSFLISCAQLPKTAKIRRIPVTGEAQAQAVIGNQIGFLKDLFKQSYDPYYHLPKWEAQCLAANQIGDLPKASAALKSVSELWLKNNEAGYCPGKDGSVHSYVIFEYCPGEGAVVEVKVPVQEGLALKDASVCP